MKTRFVKVIVVFSAVLMVFSGFMTPTVAAPKPSFNLKATPDCGFNLLEWSAVTGASSYWIYRGPGEGQEYSTPLTDFPVPDIKFKDDINIQNGKKYCYFVKAVNDQAEEFAQSNEACATPNCADVIPPDELDCRLKLSFQVANKMYKVNDAEKGPMEAAPVISLNRMFLLVRYLTEEIGALISYDAAEKKVTIKTIDNQTIELWIGKPTAKVNGVAMQIDPNNPNVVPFVLAGRTQMPMRFISEHLGATGPEDIKYFESTKIVELLFADNNCRRCICGVVEKVNCNAANPIVTIKDENGKVWSIFVTKDMCAKIKTNGCYIFCGSVRRRNPTATAVTVAAPDVYFVAVSVKPTECPCSKPEPDIKCICATILRQNCDLDKPFVMAKDENGNQIVLYVDANLCKEMLPGTCWHVCGKYNTPGPTISANLPPSIEVVKAEQTECPCKPTTEEKSFCATVVRVNYENGETLVKIDDDVTWLLLGIPADIFTKLKPGMCVKGLCIPVNQQESNIPEYKITKIEIVDCPCKPDTDLTKCVCVKIERLDCTAAQPIAYGIDGDGIKWVLYIDAYKCQNMKIGDCWKVCGTVPRFRSITAPPTMKVTSAERVDCPCPPSEQCKWIKGEILEFKESPVNSEGKFKLVFKPCGESKELSYFTNENLKDEYGEYYLSRYKGCAEICIEENWIVKWKALPNEKPCCPQEPEWICICVTVRQQHCDEDKPFILVTDENLKTWTIFLDKPLCEKFKQGTCWKICGWDITPPPTFSAATPPTLKLDMYEQVDCPCIQEECKWTKVEILSVQKIVFSDRAIFSVKLKICGEEEPIVLTTEKDLVDEKTNTALSGYKGCAEVCINDKVIVKWRALPNEKPCCHELICICFTVERQDCGANQQIVYGKDENGKSWRLVLSDDWCAMMKPGSCWEVCGTDITPVATTVASIPTMKVDTVKETKCPCKAEETPGEYVYCYCIEVINFYRFINNDILIFGSGNNGSQTLLYVSGVWEKYKDILKVGNCYNICIDYLDFSGANNTITPTDCPCKKEESPEDNPIYIELDKIVEYEDGVYIVGDNYTNYTYEPIRLFLKAEVWKKYRDILKIGNCYIIYLDPAGHGNYKINLTKCLCKNEPPLKENCFCIELVRFKLWGDGIVLFGSGKNGSLAGIVIRTPGFWEKYKDILKVGNFYTLCQEVTGGADQPIELRLTYTITPTNCPCKPTTPTTECRWRKGRIVQVKWLTDRKLSVKFIDCEKPADPVYLISDDIVDETNVFPLSQYHGCAGVCYDEKGNIVKWKALPDQKDCCKEEQEETCLCLTIEKVDCNSKPPMVTGVDQDGISWILELSRELCAKYGNYLVQGRCIRVCGIEKSVAGIAGKYLLVTSIRPTECPCKPLEENCDWIKGVIMETYTGEWVEEKYDAKIHMFFWQCVDYAGAGGRWYLAKTDLADASGKYILSKYRGCAELCIKDGIIIRWKALPDDKTCCPPPTRVGRCVNVEGIDCSADPPRFWGATTWPGEKCLVYVTKEQCEQLKIGQCFWVFGLIKTAPTGYTIAIQAERMSVADPCPCPQPINTTICIKVEKTECTTGLSYVWGKDPKGDLWILLVSQAQCNQMTPGTCWKVTGWAGSALGMREMEGISKAEKVDCSTCDEQKPKIECFCFTISKVDCRSNPPLLIGMDENGNEVILELEPWMCKRYAKYLIPKMCLNVCGYKVKIALGAEVDALGWKITSIKPMDCPCKEETEVKCFCFELQKFEEYQGGVYIIGIADTGAPTKLFLKAEVWKKYRDILKIGNCYIICLDPTGQGNYSIEQTRCPCKEETEVKCFCVTIRKVDCSTDPPKVYGVNENGDQVILVLTEEMCKKYKEILVSGKCIKVCGRLVKIPISANVDGLGWKITTIEPTECPCKEETEVKCFCFTLREISCDSNPPRLIGTNESGESVVVFVDDETCKKVQSLARRTKTLCFKVCGVLATDASGIKGWKITSIDQVDCPCGQSTNEKCMCIEIIRVACDSRTPTVYAKDQDGKLYIISVNADQCKMMQPKTCWRVCGIVGELEGNFIRFKMTTYKKVDCPCGEETKPDCICVVIEKIDCNSRQPVAYGKQSNGRQWTLYISADMCGKLKPNTCWKLCGKIEFLETTRTPIMRVATYEQVECPCEGSKPIEDCICFIVTEQNCEVDYPYILYTDSEGRSGKLDLSVLGGKEVCVAMTPGTCWKVCKVKVETGQITITLEQVRCPCPKP